MSNCKIFFILSLCLLSNAFCYGQLRKSKKESTRAIVQYEDGSVFIGQIIQEGSLSMKMVLSTKDTISINKIYIKRIRRTDKNISLYNGAKFHYTKGIFYSLQFGGNVGDNVENETSQVDLIVGYRFNKKFAAGIGFGNSYNYTFSFGTDIDANATPVFAYGRYYPIDKKIRPFIAGKIGWAFPSQEIIRGDHNGGFLIQPEIGVNFSSRRRIRFLISLGQQIQNISGELLDFDPFGNRIESKYDLWFNRTVLKVGIEWK